MKFAKNLEAMQLSRAAACVDLFSGQWQFWRAQPCDPLKRLTQFFAGLRELIAWRNLGFIQIDTTINFNLNGMLIC